VSLVASQFTALESPVGEPGVLRIDAALAPQAQLDRVIDWLALAATSPTNEASHA
jgi:gluconokinase